MKVSTETMPIVGRSSGSLIFQNVCQALAPSTRAASLSSSEMVSSPARNIMVGRPTHCQDDTSEITGRARVASPSQGRASDPRPIHSSAWLSIPQRGLRISVHRKPVTSTDMVAGVKMIAR